MCGSSGQSKPAAMAERSTAPDSEAAAATRSGCRSAHFNAP